MANEPPLIFYVVDRTVRNGCYRGIDQLVRRLAAGFARIRDEAKIVPVVWDEKNLGLYPLPIDCSLGVHAESLRVPESEQPIHNHSLFRNKLKGAWLLDPEVAYNQRTELIFNHAKALEMKVAVIFSGAVPCEDPNSIGSKIRHHHNQYMHELLSADCIFPISDFAAQSWQSFISSKNIKQPKRWLNVFKKQNAIKFPSVKVMKPAAELLDVPRRRLIHEQQNTSANATINALCVSGISPRKNHINLFKAFDIVFTANPEIRLNLKLVGPPDPFFWKHLEQVHVALQKWPDRICYYDQVDQSSLHKLYRNCDFTIYPSTLESFGFPILESLWCGLPCLCANFGAMAENARDGGCLTVNVSDPNQFADAIQTMAAPEGIRAKLSHQISNRNLKKWDEYAREILEQLSRRDY